MSEAKKRGNLISYWFDRFIAVSSPDPEEVRLGRIFNQLMILSVIITSMLSGTFVAVRYLWGFTEFPVWVAAAFPGFFVPFSLICTWLTKQGYLRRVMNLYVAVNYIAISGAAWFFDGYRSPAFLLYGWPIMVAGTLISPVSAVLLNGVTLAWFFFLWGLGALDLYTPFHSMVADGSWAYVYPAFTFVILVFSSGMVTYITGQSLRDSFSKLRRATQALDQERRTLEQRVVDRTEQMERRAQQFKLIAELSRISVAAQDLDQLLRGVANFISERFDYYHTGIFLVDETGQWAVLQAASSEGGRRMLNRGHRLSLGQGIVGYVAEAGRPRIASDVGEDRAWFNNPDLPVTRSEMALPLQIRGRTIGVLDIQSSESGAFTEEDVEVLKILADGVTSLIENARLYDETRVSLERLNRYQEEQVLLAWRNALARRNMGLNLAYDQVEVRSVPGTDALLAQPVTTDSAATKVLENGRHLLTLPVRVRSHTVGQLYFEALRPWQDDEIRLAQVVVEQLGLALDNARLLEETRLRALQEQARSEIVAQVRASVNVDAILRNVAQELGRALNVERSRVQLLPPEELNPGSV